tara:strand:+ start:413 stop:940 length:528 start_codon:yes stop_codon:yes gene_type:complete
MRTLKILLLIILFLFLVNKISKLFTKENFYPLAGTNYVTIDKSVGDTISGTVNMFNETDCCLVSKVFNKDKQEFEYSYEKKKNCNLNDSKTNMENIFIDGINGWDNKFCRKPLASDTDPLGSCKRTNFECVDFKKRSQCLKYNLDWSDKTCHTPFQKPFKPDDREISIGSKILKV